LGFAATTPLTQLETQLEHELRAIAREGIANGQLPREPAILLWGGYGSGQLCSLCGRPIQLKEIEYEIPPGEGEGHMLRFHLVCLSVWHLECARDVSNEQ
jgi:hypothetical protein